MAAAPVCVCGGGAADCADDACCLLQLQPAQKPFAATATATAAAATTPRHTEPLPGPGCCPLPQYTHTSTHARAAPRPPPQGLSLDVLLYRVVSGGGALPQQLPPPPDPQEDNEALDNLLMVRYGSTAVQRYRARHGGMTHAVLHALAAL